MIQTGGSNKVVEVGDTSFPPCSTCSDDASEVRHPHLYMYKYLQFTTVLFQYISLYFLINDALSLQRNTLHNYDRISTVGRLLFFRQLPRKSSLVI